MSDEIKAPKVFISYSWDSEEHKEWVLSLATKLQGDRVDVTIDLRNLVLGDQMPEFMENAIRENDYVLIICTPNYKKKSDKRLGGVGYEGNIMTAELSTSRNHRKFIPVLRHEKWEKSAPIWLLGKYYVSLYGQYYYIGYKKLLETLLNHQKPPSPIKQLQAVSLETNPEKQDLNISERRFENLTILDLDGKLSKDGGSVMLRNNMRRLLKENRKRIILNLGLVNYIDSSGIFELVSSFTATNKEGGELKLLNLTRKIQELLAITKLLTVFSVFEDETQAIKSFS